MIIIIKIYFIYFIYPKGNDSDGCKKQIHGFWVSVKQSTEAKTFILYQAVNMLL